MSRKEKDIRVCSVCRCEKNKSELIRITKDFKTGEYKLNLDNQVQGRSLYLCKDENCLKSALKKKKITPEMKSEVEKIL